MAQIIWFTGNKGQHSFICDIPRINP